MLSHPARNATHAYRKDTKANQIMRLKAEQIRYSDLQQQEDS